MRRFAVVALIMLALDPSTSYAARPELVTKTPQGYDFRVYQEFAYPQDLIDRADELYGRLGGPVDPHGLWLAMRYLNSTRGQYQWYMAWYDTGRQPFAWPQRQLPTAVFTDGSELKAAKIVTVSADDAKRHIPLADSYEMINPADLARSKDRKTAAMIYVGFPVGHKIRRPDGRLVNWSLNDVVRITFTPSTRTTMATQNERR